MENQEPSTFKNAMNSGIILGIVLMIISLLQNILEMYESEIFQYGIYLILIVGLVLAIKQFRDKELGGYISYGKLVGFGALTALIAGIVSGIMLYIYMKFVDDSMVGFIYDKAEQDLYDQGLSSEQIATSMSYMETFSSAGMISIMAIIGNFIIGLIISLIAGIFMKKERDTFAEE